MNTSGRGQYWEPIVIARGLFLDNRVGQFREETTSLLQVLSSPLIQVDRQLPGIFDETIVQGCCDSMFSGYYAGQCRLYIFNQHSRILVTRYHGSNSAWLPTGRSYFLRECIHRGVQDFLSVNAQGNKANIQSDELIYLPQRWFKRESIILNNRLVPMR